tara:strand:- start:574 stop:963 length:390 start_codon:yes stop_codon:yes gene_type:complete
MIRNAKNGCNTEVKFRGKKVYYTWEVWDTGIAFSMLGNELDTEDFVKNQITDESYLGSVQNLLVDWKLYENGWLVDKYQNQHLFYYLCQMGNYGRYRPKELEYFKDLKIMNGQNKIVHKQKEPTICATK